MRSAALKYIFQSIDVAFVFFSLSRSMCECWKWAIGNSSSWVLLFVYLFILFLCVNVWICFFLWMYLRVSVLFTAKAATSHTWVVRTWTTCQWGSPPTRLLPFLHASFRKCLNNSRETPRGFTCSPYFGHHQMITLVSVAVLWENITRVKSYLFCISSADVTSISPFPPSLSFFLSLFILSPFFSLSFHHSPAFFKVCFSLYLSHLFPA